MPVWALRRRATVAVVVPAAVLAAVLVVAWIWLRTSLPDYDGTVEMRGLSAEAVISRDRHAVPHIRAASLEDALFALGFAHGQDRLFMLELYRLASQGRFAELVGPSGIEWDIAIRLTSAEVTRENVLSFQEPRAIARMTAYVAGINGFLDQRVGALPPEFLYLGVTPTRWTVADAFMIDNLTDAARSGWLVELAFLRLQRDLPLRVVEALQSDFAELDLATLRKLPGLKRAAAAPSDLRVSHGPSIGLSRASNAWAVERRRSESGDVLFAADPHLGLELPSTFTPVRISTPTLHFAGFVIPGIAWFVGHTQHQHWGMTHAAEDMTDVFVEETNPSGTHYRTSEGWNRIEIIDQTIKVRGEPDVPLRIRRTPRGPIISDHVPAARQANTSLPPNRVLVLAGVDATALSGGGRQYGLNHELLMARSLVETDHLLQRNIDVDNLIYADDSGNIAIRTVAAVLKRSGRNGLRPSDGALAEESAGTQLLPTSELPRATNPPAGCVFNANQPVKSGSDHCGEAVEYSLRAERLRSRLTERRQHTLESFRSIQLDTVSLAARKMLPALRVLTFQDPVERRALAELLSWDGDAHVQSAAASIFHVWLREFDAAMVGALSTQWSVELPHPTLRRYSQMLQQGSVWCQLAPAGSGVGDARAACLALARIAFSRAVAALRSAAGDDPAAWRWGRFHYAVFEHPVFSQVPWLRWFAERRASIPGGPETINAANAAWQKGVEFPVLHGPLTRRLERVGHPESNWVAFAGGVSGNPLSPHYDDQIAPWSRGEYFSIEGRDDTLSSDMRTLRLLPKK